MTDPRDPEAERIQYLIDRKYDGLATAAERTELAIYEAEGKVEEFDEREPSDSNVLVRLETNIHPAYWVAGAIAIEAAIVVLAMVPFSFSPAILMIPVAAWWLFRR